jgi:hypothetical protein
VIINLLEAKNKLIEALKFELFKILKSEVVSSYPDNDDLTKLKALVGKFQIKYFSSESIIINYSDDSLVDSLTCCKYFR